MGDAAEKRASALELLQKAKSMIDVALHELGESKPPEPLAKKTRRLKIKEFANMQGVSVGTVRRWINAGMPIYQMSKRLIRIDPTEAGDWVRRGGHRGQRPPLTVIDGDG